MVKVLSLEERLSFNGAFKDPHSVTFTTIKLTDDLEAKCWASPTTEAAGISLHGNNWSIEHKTASRDTKFKVKRKGPLDTKITLSQEVPANKWYLVPNPEIEISKTGVFGDHNKVELEWDFLDRAGEISAKAYGGDDKEYKAEVELHSKKGAFVGARAKLRKGALHSLAAGYGTYTGPELTLKSRVIDGTKLKLKYTHGKQLVKAEAKYKVATGDEGSGKTATTTMEVLLPVGKGGLEPMVTFGVKYAFE